MSKRVIPMGKREFFGYRVNAVRQNTDLTTDWFDPGQWLIRGITRLSSQSNHRSNWIMLVCLFVIFCMFSIRLYNLQITRGNQNLLLAEGNRIRREVRSE